MATQYYRPYTSQLLLAQSQAQGPFQDGEMPPYHAMETVLPEYQYIFHDGKPHGQGKKTSPRAGPKDTKYEADELEKNSILLIDHQTKELENHRGAVHRMGQDIITLRSQVRDLENLNSNLRRDLANYNDSSRLMVESAELDGCTKPEILSRYAAIKQTLATQTDELKNYKTKLQHVQNELIKKNDQEKEYLRIQKAHATQQAVIQKLQDKLKKLKKLEETCKQQEDMIQKMERVLERHHRERGKGNKDKGAQEANEALIQENKLLRSQIDDLKAQLRISGSGSGDDLEKMELLQALEKCEGRIAALEKQLADNSRNWGKERADLTLKLNEAEHGFGRSAGMVLHDYPIYNNERIGGSKTNLKRLSPMYR